MRNTIDAILDIINETENTYPMTGKPDPRAEYKNGWYDASFHIKGRVKQLLKGRPWIKKKS